MAALALRARFPLGYFQGHSADRSASTLPSLARLHASLVHAAHTGVTALPGSDGALTASPESESALRWLEEHAPTSLSIPPHQPMSPGGASAFRDEGSFTKTRDKALKRVSDGTAINGFLGWTWADECPDDIREQIDLICADVSCLGEADSPVVLEVARAEPTHDLNPAATALDRNNVIVDAPALGRLDLLRGAHAGAHPRKRPSVKDDAATATARPRSHQPPQQGLRQLAYVPRVLPPPDIPWVSAILLPTSSVIGAEYRVRACVALHRAIISRIGDGAPPVVTGSYPRGVARPSNRVALQYLPPGLPSARLGAGGAFAVLIPDAIDPSDLETLARALGGMRTLRTPFAEVHLAEPRHVPTQEFWNAPVEGMSRWWAPSPALVPETRGVRDRQPWGFRESALLSVGFLLRNRFEVAPNGPERFRRMVEQVTDWGVSVVGAQRISDSRTERYVHTLPAGMVAHPYRALLSMADTLPATALWALGQTRHLGGGLMLPVDITTDATEAMKG